MAGLRELVDNPLSGMTIVETSDADAVSDGFTLYRTIETEIIPRLMLVHSSPREAASPPDLRPGLEDLQHFVDAILDADRELGRSFIEGMRLRGMSVESVIMDLLSPTAQFLGEMWRQDLCSFAEVTIGLSRLQRILRELSSDFGSRGDGSGAGCSILLAATPGEQHTFGICVVEEFFRRSGWHAVYLAAPTRAEIIRTLRNDHYDVLGLSVSSDELFGTLASVIRDARRATCNKAMGVMVGGNVLVGKPGWAARLGADLVAVDGADAVRQAQAFVELAGVSGFTSRRM